MGAHQHGLGLVPILDQELIAATAGELVEDRGLLHEQHHERVHVRVLRKRDRDELETERA
jgi:hypothetical protein